MNRGRGAQDGRGRIPAACACGRATTTGTARCGARTRCGRNDEGPADPANGTGALHWQFELDANGNQRVSIDPKGLVTAREHGVLNRLERVSYARPLQVAYPLLRSVAYEYDGNGNVELVTEEKETASGTVYEQTDPTYDTLDRVASEQRYDGKVVRYEYDLKGNRRRVTDPDQVATSYEYDGQDRLVLATTPEGATTYRYWPDGLEQGKTLPNGVEEGRCYDAAGQLTGLVTARGVVGSDCQTAAVVVSRFGYEYDGNGNRTVQSEQRTIPGALAPGAAEETRYGYDGLDRLVGVRYGDGQAVLYRLDATGNRTGERELTGQPADVDLRNYAGAAASALVRDVTGTFNRADWLVSRVDARDGTRSETFGWDLAGNLVTRSKAGQTRQLRWDARNTLTAVLENGVVVGNYDYDAGGMRVKRRTAGEQVEYVLDEGHVLQETRGDLESHPSYRRYHYAYGPLSVTDAGGAQFIGTDALGSTTDLTSTTGAVVAARQYDAWGQYRKGTAPAAADAKLGYTGHQYDPETGLVYARARYYDPELGVFISRDAYAGELADAPSLHRYAYARGNPLAYLDPAGNDSVWVGMGKAYVRETLLPLIFDPLGSFRSMQTLSSVGQAFWREGGKRFFTTWEKKDLNSGIYAGVMELNPAYQTMVSVYDTVEDFESGKREKAGEDLYRSVNNAAATAMVAYGIKSGGT